MVSITEANQNFSKVARLVDENGSVIILKNNVPRYLVMEFSAAEQEQLADDERYHGYFQTSHRKEPAGLDCGYFITYLVPLPLPSIFTTPFLFISFSNCVIFDFPNGA